MRDSVPLAPEDEAPGAGEEPSADSDDRLMLASTMRRDSGVNCDLIMSIPPFFMIIRRYEDAGRAHRATHRPEN